LYQKRRKVEERMKFTGFERAVFPLLALALLATGCYAALDLRTTPLGDEGSIRGTFDVVYYTDEFGSNPGTLVVLDVADDEYTIIPYAPESTYSIEKGVPAPEAIARAKRFLAFNTFYESAAYRTIYAPGGAVAGYQVTPQYESFTLISRAEHAHYFLEEGGIIRVSVPQPDRGDWLDDEPGRRIKDE
jgi:hypothetical protein